MFNFFRIPGLLSGLLLALVASTGTTWAQTTNQNASVPPVTVNLQVPTIATATSTTIQLQIRTDIHSQQTAIQVTSDANPAAPTIIAASVGSDSVATVPVDASDAFVWAVSPNPTRPGCGPHPPAGTPGCARTDITTASPQPGKVVLGPAALAAASGESSIEVAGVRTTAGAESSTPSGPVAITPDPSATPESALDPSADSVPLLQYTVQPGDTLTAVARRFYGDTGALDRIVRTNLDQPMPDGRVFADANHIRPGWVLSLPQPAQVAYERDGQRWYVVQPGDTLSSIAARLLGSANRWHELYALNSDHIAAPSRIRVGAKLQLPVSQPGIETAQAGQDDEAVQVDRPQADATTRQLETVAAAPTSAPGSRIAPPTWASSRSANLDAAVMGDATPADPPAAGGAQRAVETPSVADTGPHLPSELRPDRVTPSGSPESQGMLPSPRSARQPLAAAAATDAMLLSGITLGVWLFRRRARTRFQPRAALLAIRSPAQPCSVASAGSQPRTNFSSPSDTDRRARRRARVLQSVLDGTCTNENAATQLEVSTRQLRRLLAAYRDGGVDALRHANAGRVPRHAVPDAVRNQIVELVRTRYAGLSQSELVQRLATEHGIQLHRTTVRRILLAADLEASHATGSPADCDSEPLAGSARRAVHGQGPGHGGALIWESW